MLRRALRGLKHLLGSSSDLDELIKRAHQELELHRFEVATKILTRVLRRDPEKHIALNLQGYALCQLGELSTAREYAEKAISLYPSGKAYHSNLADILEQQGEFADAEEMYRRQLELTPQYPEAYLHLSRFLATRGKDADALNLCKEAIVRCPDSDAARVHAAFYLQNFSLDHEAVLEVLKPVLARPDNINASACILASRSYFSLNNVAGAERLLTAVLAVEPDNIEALIGMGTLRMSGLRAEEADAYFRLAMGIAPSNKLAAQLLASLKLETGFLDEANDLLSAFAHEYPDDITFCRLKADLASRTNKALEAQAHLEHALAIAPEDVEVLEQFGVLKMSMGNVRDGLSLLRKAETLLPSRTKTQYNLSYALLMSGDLKSGFASFEARLKIAYDPETPYHLRAIMQPMQEAMRRIKPWDGKTPLDGRRLVVWPEQGLGDWLMIMRLLPQLRNLGPAKLDVVAHREVIKITAAMSVTDQVIPSREWEAYDRSPDYDLHCSIMSLPYFLGITIESAANTVPYVKAPQAATDKWRQALKAAEPDTSTQLKVGLVWGGSANLVYDRARSVSFDQFASLIQTRDVQWVSLQKGTAQQQLRNTRLPILDFMDDCDDFQDTAALIETLDLVISVDTSVAHLAGALGKPVWLLNRAGSEWRWMQGQEKSYWYPSMQIFNQAPGEEWEAVIERIAESLRHAVQNQGIA